MKYKIHILVGLPGSGKTFFSESFNQDLVTIFNLDPEHGGLREDEIYFRLSNSIPHYCREIIFDGLILTAEDLKRITTPIISWAEDKGHSVNFEVHYWKESREACLKNDLLRISRGSYFDRSRDSGITIKNAALDSPEKLEEILDNIGRPYTIDLRDVYTPTGIDLEIHKYSSHNREGKYVINSESWCNGGSWCDCWGNSGTVEADDPLEFTAFDELLGKICPRITFLQYKKLFKECVTLKTYYESDYYGGSTSNSYYQCEIFKLKDTLKEMELLK